jgi:N6-adenosine-specific RNA methylase IME4
MTALIKFNEAYQALMVAKSIDEVKDILDQAAALKAIYKQAGDCLEMQNACAEIIIRGKVRGADIADNMQANGQLNGHGGDRKSSSQDANLNQPDVDWKEVHRWRQIKAVPEEVRENFIAETKAQGKELTSAGVLKLGKELKQKQEYNQTKETVIPDSVNHILADVRHVTLAQLGGIPFKAIILDPAWDFEAWEKKTGDAKSPEYDLMTLEDIYNLPVAQLSDPDCVLFLWATNPFLPQALRAMESYGFSYRSKFPWIKTTLKNQMLDYGTGYWVRGVSEDVLIGVRGNVTAPRLENFLGLIGPNIEHSRKPQDVHRMAEATTTGPFLELFARYSRPKWVTVGNEYRGERPIDPIPSPNPPWLRGNNEKPNSD